MTKIEIEKITIGSVYNIGKIIELLPYPPWLLYIVNERVLNVRRLSEIVSTKHVCTCVLARYGLWPF